MRRLCTCRLRKPVCRVPKVRLWRSVLCGFKSTLLKAAGRSRIQCRRVGIPASFFLRRNISVSIFAAQAQFFFSFCAFYSHVQEATSAPPPPSGVTTDQNPAPPPNGQNNTPAQISASGLRCWLSLDPHRQPRHGDIKFTKLDLRSNFMIEMVLPLLVRSQLWWTQGGSGDGSTRAFMSLTRGILSASEREEFPDAASPISGRKWTHPYTRNRCVDLRCTGDGSCEGFVNKACAQMIRV